MHDVDDKFEVYNNSNTDTFLPPTRADQEAVGRYPHIDNEIKITRTHLLRLELEARNTEDSEKKQKLYDKMQRLKDDVTFMETLSKSHIGWGDFQPPEEVAFSQIAVERFFREHPHLAQLQPEYTTVYLHEQLGRGDIATLDEEGGRGFITGLKYKKGQEVNGMGESLRAKYRPIQVLSALRVPVQTASEVDALPIAA